LGTETTVVRPAEADELANRIGAIAEERTASDFLILDMKPSALVLTTPMRKPGYFPRFVCASAPPHDLPLRLSLNQRSGKRLPNNTDPPWGVKKIRKKLAAHLDRYRLFKSTKKSPWRCGRYIAVRRRRRSTLKAPTPSRPSVVGSGTEFTEAWLPIKASEVAPVAVTWLKALSSSV
jgi:hypothetical protein